MQRITKQLSAIMLITFLFIKNTTQDSSSTNYRRHESSNSPSNRNSLTQLGNVTEIINLLLVGYDIRLRPDFGGPPLNITMDLAIASFDEISEVNMDYTLTLYLHQHWKDKRLAFSENNYELTLSADFAEKIWVPDLFFANDKNSFLHEVTEKNKMIRLKSNGEVSYGMRFSSQLACMMDLHYYPLDSQNCSIEIESYGYTVSDVVMYWSSTPVVGIQEAKLSQFKIKSYSTHSSTENLATGVYQTYLPSTLIVLISMLGFWINSEATSARVGLGISAVLTITTISAGVRSTLPRISYVKAIDIYLFVCFIFVFSALLEYSAVNYTYWTSRAKKKNLKKMRTDLQSKLDRNERKFAQSGEQANQVQQSDLDSIDEQLRATIMNADDYLLSAALSAPPIDSQFSTDDLNELNTSLQLNAAELNLNALNNIINHQTYDVNNLVLNPQQQQQSYPPNLNQPSSLSGLSGNQVYPEFDSMLPNHLNQQQPDGNLNHQFREQATKLNQRIQQENTIELLLKKRLKLLQSLRRLSKWTKVKNVNKIDTYSRILFPTSFLLFNIVYWAFYKL